MLSLLAEAPVLVYFSTRPRMVVGGASLGSINQPQMSGVIACLLSLEEQPAYSRNCTSKLCKCSYDLTCHCASSFSLHLCYLGTDAFTVAIFIIFRPLRFKCRYASRYKPNTYANAASMTGNPSCTLLRSEGVEVHDLQCRISHRPHLPVSESS